MRKLLKFSNQDNGYSLAGVLVIFIVATVLGMSIVALSVNSMNISNKEHDDQSAFYIAESGTTYRVAQVETLVESATTETEDFITNEIENPANSHLYGSKSDDEIEEIIRVKFFNILDEKLNPSGVINPVDYNDFEVIKGNQPEAVITVERKIISNPTENPRTYNIVSKGTIGDESRLVNLPVEIEFFPKPKYAILTKDGIEIVGNEINGDIGTISPDSEVIIFPGGNPILNGEIFVPNGDENAILIGGSWINVPMPPKALAEDTRIPDLPDFPSFPTLPSQGVLNVTQGGVNRTEVISEDLRFEEIRIGSANTLTLDIGAENRKMVVGNLNIVNGHIKIIGSGTLTLYVENQFTMGSGSNINIESQISQLDIYYAGPSISLNGAQKVYGSLHADNATIKLAAGSHFYGNIFSGGPSIEIEGGTSANSQIIIAPNAEVTHSNGTINGMVVSKTYKASGGATLNYKNNPVSNGPISLDGLMNDPANVGNTFMQRKDPDLNKQSLREK